MASSSSQSTRTGRTSTRGRWRRSSTRNAATSGAGSSRGTTAPTSGTPSHWSGSSPAASPWRSFSTTTLLSGRRVLALPPFSPLPPPPRPHSRPTPPLPSQGEQSRHLLPVRPYHYFGHGKSPGKGEERDQQLAHSLSTLREVHAAFYAAPLSVDVATELSVLRRRVLGGARIVFSEYGECHVTHAHHVPRAPQFRARSSRPPHSRPPHHARPLPR